MKAGDIVYLHQVERIETIQPPELDGKRVAFVYLFWKGSSYSVIFDLTPNLPTSLNETVTIAAVSQMVSGAINTLLAHKTIVLEQSAAKALQKVGLWAVPALLPYPLAEIIRRIMMDGDEHGARHVLMQHCTPAFLVSLAAKWWTIPHFQDRRTLLTDALGAHQRGQFTLSIHTLLPQVEGVITDWMYATYPTEKIPWRQESKTKKFRDLTFKEPPTDVDYNRIVESVTDFMIAGPMLSTFATWTQSINSAFPNRNVLSHGRMDPSLYTEENSAKLFLMLDTIFHLTHTKT